MYCPKCYKNIPDGSASCPFCGTRTKKKKFPLIPVVIVIISLIVTIVVIAGKNRKTEPEQNQNVQIESSETIQITDDRLKIGSVTFSTILAENVTELAENTYMLSLSDGAAIGIFCSDVSNLDSDQQSLFLDNLPQITLEQYPNRTDLGNIDIYFADQLVNFIVFHSGSEDSAPFQIVGAFLYEDHAYTIRYADDNAEEDEILRLEVFLTSSAFETTGVAWSNGIPYNRSTSSTQYGVNSLPQSATATTEELEALETAKSYLSIFAFSKEGLVDQLEYDGFSDREITYALNHMYVDWKQQAVNCAKSYLETSAFSYSGLIDQLEFDGFTSSEATYGVDNCRADWYDQAVECAKGYRRSTGLSGERLIRQLEYEGFTSDQARHGEQKTR